MEQQETEKIALAKKRVWLALIPAILFVSIIWLVFLIGQTLLDRVDIMRLGLTPGEITGLRGVIFSPLLHSSVSHLWSNTLSLLILIWFLFYFYSKIALNVFAALWIISGVVTWLIGRNALHVGASGLVFAMLFFLFFSGIFRKYIPLVAVSLIVAFIYGGSVWSILPITELIDASISWEGHLSGAISGLLMAVVYRREGPQKPEVVWEEEDEEEDEELMG
ncbi:MAG: Membrane associated serine protease [Proteiniphilum sp.]|nr:Membrane associated serine protease [Proteiniphilum sp.]